MDAGLQQVKEIWQPGYGHPLSDEDARSISFNLTGFFKVLARWQAQDELREPHANP